jgi:hypothetical protein
MHQKYDWEILELGNWETEISKFPRSKFQNPPQIGFFAADKPIFRCKNPDCTCGKKLPGLS